MNSYDELMNHAAEFRRSGYRIEKPKEESTMPAVSGTASSVKSAQQILANDNQPRTVSRAPAYVPPQGARNHNAPLAPDDVEDCTASERKTANCGLNSSACPRRCSCSQACLLN